MCSFHKDLEIMRPCGHVLCYPCFVRSCFGWQNQLPDMVKTFSMLAQPNSEIKDVNKPCPVCEKDIVSAFNPLKLF